MFNVSVLEQRRCFKGAIIGSKMELFKREIVSLGIPTERVFLCGSHFAGHIYTQTHTLLRAKTGSTFYSTKLLFLYNSKFFLKLFVSAV